MTVRKKPIKKEVHDINELPKGWKVLTDKKNPVIKLNDKLQQQLVILSITTKTNKGNDVTYTQFIGTRQALMSQEVSKIKTDLLENNKNVVFSPQKDNTLILEIYKTALELQTNNKAKKDYSEEKGVIKQVHDLFVKAIKEGVSDIHIEVREGFTVIRGRVNGEISKLFPTSLAETTGREWARVIYQVMSTVSNTTFNERTQQDALVEGVFGGDKLRVRVATNPTEPAGFDMTMRLLVIQDSKNPLKLSDLGYQKNQETMIKDSVAQPVGLTIIAGTTGSGKSTTLQNVLMTKINERNYKIKVITVEDPPEYFIPGASQVPVIRDEKGDAKMSFKKAIKSAMRSDPDILMIGEIRDEQSAELLIEAVQSGHQVLSTVHASSALGIINRLENLGISRDILGSPEFIAGLIYQKLLPTLCPHCSIPLKEGFIPSRYPVERIIIDDGYCTIQDIERIKATKGDSTSIVRKLQDAMLLDSKQANDILKKDQELNPPSLSTELFKRITKVVGNVNDFNIKFRGNGCEHCKGKGITGRTVVSEVIRPDMKMLSLISENRDGELIAYWRKNLNGKFAAEDAYDKMKLGIVSPIDVENELGLIGHKLI